MKIWTRDSRIWLALSLGAILTAEGVWLRSECLRGSGLALRWQTALRQEEQLAGFTPAPTLENEQAIAAEAAQLRRDLPGRRAHVRPNPEPDVARGGETAAIDAYFGLAAMTARLRARAAATEVVLKSDERFGFDAYSHESPGAADMNAVWRQCRIGEVILGCLFDARPQTLVAVKRERVELPGATRDHQAPDYFVVPPSLSLRRAGEIETVAFRIEFRGETPVLRRFLGTMEHASEILVVRSIDVAPPEGTRAKPAGPRDAPMPFVQPGVSQFTVVVEAVHRCETAAAIGP